MSFYEPEIFTNASEIELLKAERILQPIWDWLKNDREDFLRSPLFPPILGVGYYFLATGLFTVVSVNRF